MRQWSAEAFSDSPNSEEKRAALLSCGSRLNVNKNLGVDQHFNYDLRQNKMQCTTSFPSRPRCTGTGKENNSCSQRCGMMEEEEDEEVTSSQRLSRHVPQRDGMDMAISSFNLIASPHSLHSVTTPSGASGSRSAALADHNATGTAIYGIGAATSSSAFTSLSESLVSDDSTYLTSLYNDRLVANFMRKGTGRHGAPMEGDDADDERPSLSSREACAKGLEVLSFAGDCEDGNGTKGLSHTFAYPLAKLARGVPNAGVRGSGAAISGGFSALDREARRFSMSSSGGRSTASARVLTTTPYRVLDAPEFPANASQLLDWGPTNTLAIAMKNTLYAWNADSGQASKLVDLDEAISIRCVHWLHKGNCVAIGVQDGMTAIFDCRSNNFLRTVRLPAEVSVTGLTVNGPVLAVSSASERGTTCAFDLRAKNALIATYEGHLGEGGVRSVQYCSAEPFYLATGGADGHLRIWDARRSSAPRYAFDRVHQGPINALRWNPEKRSRLFSGGDDGVLCALDTHAQKRTLELDNADEDICSGTRCAGDQLTQYVTRAVNTQFPISSLVCHNGSGELATAHKGKGHLQLRKTGNFHLVGTFTSGSDAALSCLTLAPDRETVCAAQADETLKFWRVFDNNAATLRNGPRGEPQDWQPPVGTHGGYQDPSALFEKQPLR